MKILKVKNPFQDKHTKPEDIQILEGTTYSWCVKTEMSREKDGGFNSWLEEKISFIEKHENVIGIFLYDVKALYQEITGEGKDIVHYVRFDYIKKQDTSDFKEWVRLREETKTEEGGLCYCGHTDRCDCGDPDSKCFTESVDRVSVIFRRP